jgi:hypothetical protein
MHACRDNFDENRFNKIIKESQITYDLRWYLSLYEEKEKENLSIDGNSRSFISKLKIKKHVRIGKKKKKKKLTNGEH